MLGIGRNNAFDAALDFSAQAAFSGFIGGIIFTCILSFFFGGVFHVVQEVIIGCAVWVWHVLVYLVDALRQVKG